MEKQILKDLPLIGVVTLAYVIARNPRVDIGFPIHLGSRILAAPAGQGQTILDRRLDAVSISTTAHVQGIVPEKLLEECRHAHQHQMGGML
jgi:hypothetical protein